jgi:hypothetical protein
LRINIVRAIALALALLFPLLASAGERPVAPPLPGGSSEFSREAIVASNGSTFAVAWTGSGPRVAIFDEQGHELARVPQLTEGLALPQDIAAVGRDYILLYGWSNTLYAAILREDGSVVSNRSVLPGWGGTVAVIGSNALIMNERGGAILIDTTGRAAPKPSILRSGDTFSPDVAAGSSGFFAVWLENGEVRGSTIDPSATIAGAAVTIGPSDAVGYSGDRPSIASDGDGFVVAWKAGSDIRVANIDGNGAPSMPRTIAGDATGVPSIAWNGRDDLVVYPSGHDVVTIELAANRITRLRREDTVDHPRVAASFHAALIAREEYGACFGRHGIVASFAGAADSFLVTTGIPAQTDTAAAADARTSAVTFIERGEAWRLRIAFAPFDGGTIDLPSRDELSYPAMASGAGEFLVAWLERQNDCSLTLNVAVADPHRRSIEPHILATKVGSGRPLIAWNGYEFVVLWQRSNAAELDAARVAIDGTPIDTTPMALTIPVPPPDAYTSESAISPSLRWTGSEWLLVWQALQATYIPLYPYPTPSVSNVRTRRIGRDLRPVSGEKTIATGAWNPSMDSSEPLVVWLESGALVAARLGADGSPAAKIVATDLHPSFMALTCSAKECAVAADAQVLRLSRDGAAVVASQTLDGAVRAITNDGSSFLVATSRDQQLFVTDLAPIGPRRRIAAR